MDKLIEMGLKVIGTIIFVSMMIIFGFILYVFCIFIDACYGFPGGIIECINYLNDEMINDYIKPFLRNLKEYWDE